MRCDGVKPACQQCCRAKKADCCEYDDGKGKTRTQILREHIARLEQRIRELEDPDCASPAIALYDPHTRQCSGSSPSSHTGSPGSNTISTPPFLSESASSPLQGSWSHLPVLSPALTPFGDLYHFEDSYPSFELEQMLLDIFAPHRHQCGLEIDMGRLRDSVALPKSEQHHPALMNAIFLWSCYVSRPGPLCQHEAHYLARTHETLGEALQHNDKVVDVVQASCLLSLYFLSNGRMLEGGYHASAAASLAAQCGMHGATARRTNGYFDPADSFKVESTKAILHEEERMLAFWQAYNLDCCWSVVLRKPPAIYDAPAPGFLGGSTLALRVKASALFERADRLSFSWDPGMSISNSKFKPLTIYLH
jgi:hypothetical protein